MLTAVLKNNAAGLFHGPAADQARQRLYDAASCPEKDREFGDPVQDRNKHHVDRYHPNCVLRHLLLLQVALQRETRSTQAAFENLGNRRGQVGAEHHGVIVSFVTIAAAARYKGHPRNRNG